MLTDCGYIVVADFKKLNLIEMIHRIDETIEMKDLPTWLQELWEQNPSLARRAEKHYLELTEQCNIADVSISLERAKKYARNQHFLGTQGRELVEFEDWAAKD